MGGALCVPLAQWTCQSRRTLSRVVLGSLTSAALPGAHTPFCFSGLCAGQAQGSQAKHWQQVGLTGRW
jgi:hypothetical protein